MDTDGFSLTTISEKSIIDNDITSVHSNKHNKRAPLRRDNSIGGIENGDNSMLSPNYISTSKSNQSTPLETSIYSTQSTPLETSIYSTQSIEETLPNVDYTTSEVTDIPDEDNANKQEEKIVSQRTSQLITDHDNTIVSSYATGGENDVIEIHQFSTADIDAYLDIYFETLDNRLRHYMGDDEQLQQFRVAMKNRINSNPNAHEYQNVLLGKMNGEVLAAITISFPGDTPTIPRTLNLPQQNSCLKSIRHWIIQKANYIPTNIQECYIEMIGVKSAYRGHGIGSAMLECVENIALQGGARLLTIHIYGQQLRNFFEHHSFNIDHTDNSSFWKWIIERQTINKFSKILSSNGENVNYTTGSYINESMVGNTDE